MNTDKRNLINELTEGMQRLCAVANRIVATGGERIETDLLMDNLRRLYDIALRMQQGQTHEVPTSAVDSASQPEAIHPHEAADTQTQTLVMMSTLAAMGGAQAEESEPQPAPAVMPVEETPSQVVDNLVFEEVIVDAIEEPQPQAIPADEPQQPMEEEVAETPMEIPLAPEPTVEPEAEPEPPAAAAPMAEAEPQPEVEEEAAPVTTPVDPEPPTAPAPAEAEAPKAPRQASLLDYLQQPLTSTLGDRLSAQHPLHESTLPKVDDLRTIINIGDRYTFVNELFGGSMEEYNHFIADLNALKERDAAMTRLNEASQRHHWNQESAAVSSFMRVFDKKF